MPRITSVGRMKNCIELFLEYKNELKKAKEEDVEPSRRKFEFFQVPVLGTFHSFCKRLTSVSIV